MKIFKLKEIEEQTNGLSVKIARMAIRRGELKAFRATDCPTSPYLVTEEALNNWIRAREEAVREHHANSLPSLENRLGPRLRQWRGAWYIFQPRLMEYGSVSGEERVRCKSKGASTEDERNQLLEACIARRHAAIMQIKAQREHQLGESND